MAQKIQDGVIRIAAGRHNRRVVTHTVDERWLVAYVAAIGDTSDEVFDVERPGGIVAHPVFPACLEWPLVARGAPGIELTTATLNRGLHVAQTSKIYAPISSDAVLTTTARLVIAEQRSTAVHIGTEFATVDEADRCVCVTRTHMLYPGVVLDGTGIESPASPDVGPTPPDGVMTLVGEFDVSLTNAVTYAECARIWNPIHTDPRVAKAAGLSAPVLHGTETLARAISIIASTFGWPLADVASYTCRFTAPVTAGDRLRVRAGGSGAHATTFEVVNDDGVTVVADATLVVGG